MFGNFDKIELDEMTKLYFEYRGHLVERSILYEIAIEKYEVNQDKPFVIIFLD